MGGRLGGAGQVACACLDGVPRAYPVCRAGPTTRTDSRDGAAHLGLLAPTHVSAGAGALLLLTLSRTLAPMQADGVKDPNAKELIEPILSDAFVETERRLHTVGERSSGRGEGCKYQPNLHRTQCRRARRRAWGLRREGVGAEDGDGGA